MRGLGCGATLGIVACGGPPPALPPAPPPATVEPTQRYADLIAVGGDFACGQRGDDFRCWGQGDRGQLANGSRRNRAMAVVSADEPYRAVALGRAHGCAITGEGQVRCWGANGRGQLGVPPEAFLSGEHLFPVTVPKLEKVRAIAAGSEHSCAIEAEGAVVCWGSPAAVLGEPDADETAWQPPVRIAGIDSAQSLHISHDLTCVLEGHGELSCWNAGYSDLYDIFNRPCDEYEQLCPSDVERIAERVTAVALGTSYVAAQHQDGSATLWHGMNEQPLPLTLPAGVNDLVPSGPRLCVRAEDALLCSDDLTAGCRPQRDGVCAPEFHRVAGPTSRVAGAEYGVCWQTVDGFRCQKSGDKEVTAVEWSTRSELLAAREAARRALANQQHQARSLFDATELWLASIEKAFSRRQAVEAVSTAWFRAGKVARGLSVSRRIPPDSRYWLVDALANTDHCDEAWREAYANARVLDDALLTRCARSARAEVTLNALEKRGPTPQQWLQLAQAWHFAGHHGRRDAAFAKVPLSQHDLRHALRATGARPAAVVTAVEQSLPSPSATDGTDHFERAQFWRALGFDRRAVDDTKEAMKRKFGGKAPKYAGDATVLVNAALVMHEAGDTTTAKQWLDRVLSSGAIVPTRESFGMVGLLNGGDPARRVLEALVVMDLPRAERLAAQWGMHYPTEVLEYRLHHAVRRGDWVEVEAAGGDPRISNTARKDALVAALSKKQCSVAASLSRQGSAAYRLEAIVELVEVCPKARVSAQADLAGIDLDAHPFAGARALASTGDIAGALERALSLQGEYRELERAQVLALAARWQGDKPLTPKAQSLLKRLIEGARPAP